MKNQRNPEMTSYVVVKRGSEYKTNFQKLSEAQ